jgi:tetratricopeptide (TPR) repeat protein
VLYFALSLLLLLPFQDQEKSIQDEIIENIASAGTLEEKYSALIDACETLIYDDHDAVIKYGMEAAEVARKLKEQTYEVRALARVSGAYMRKKNIEKATELVDQAMSIAKENGHPDILFYAFWFKADLDFKMGRFESSIEGYLKAVDILPENHHCPCQQTTQCGYCLCQHRRSLPGP